MRKTYTTDLSDAEWACLKNHLPASKLPGKMRTHALREIFDAIFYVLKSGCPWRLLSGDFPPWQTVFYHFRRFRLSGLWHRIFTILRAVERKRNGKDPNPSAAIMDSQSIKTTEESAGWKGYEAHSNGYDAHKHVKGRKRHLLVDTLWLPLSIYATPADVQDRVGARWLLAGLKPLMPRLKKIWADGVYGGDPLAQWCHKEGGWSRADPLLDRSESEDEQGLRAEGSDKRDSDLGCDDPAYVAASSESSLNLAKHPGVPVLPSRPNVGTQGGRHRGI